MDKQILKEFPVFLLNCEINSLPLKSVCLYVYKYIVLYEPDCGLFHIAIGRTGFLYCSTNGFQNTSW